MARLSSQFVSRTHQRARDAVAALPTVSLGRYPTAVEELTRLRGALGAGPRLLVKRDDAIPFALGGNKVRKLELVLGEAKSQNADTLVTVGGVHSNHARVTAAAAARLGLGCRLLINGARPDRPTGNARLHELTGATIEYIPDRAARAPAMASALEQLRAQGKRPYAVPLGASTPLGALGYVRAVGELVSQGLVPDAIVVATSSGGTLAGILAGVELHTLATRVVGVSADDPAASIAAVVRDLLDGMTPLLGLDVPLGAGLTIEVDDSFVGGGYGVATPASTEALELAARSEGLFLDPTYTAKAMAALISYVRTGRFRGDETVLFWHTGGQVELTA
ncbi:MAG: pyridoxal-phosphate dependent enzyme [Gemmatimonadetes bacterium]|nr:pyridoxal-phosphate dependent enzyme [Gemmatimonadota bacterium]